MTPRYRVRVLFDEAAIARRLEGMAQSIVGATAPDLIVVAILKGGFVFAADLIRALHRAKADPEVEFIHIARGETGEAHGHPNVLRDVEGDVSGRDVLLVGDILESGRTLSFAKDLMMARGARRVLIAVLLEKRTKRRAVRIEADFVGFPCPDAFVVGYGMDVGHKFRQLPFVGIVAHGAQEADLFDTPGG